MMLLGAALCAPLACSPNGHSNNPNNSVIVVGSEPAGTDAPEQFAVNSVVGAEVIVDLPFNAGTGYSWSMSSHSDGVELVGTPETKALKGDLPGGPMLATYTLKVTKAGRQTARMELARAWETDTPAARTVDLVIIASTTP